MDAAILSAHAKNPWGRPGGGEEDPPVHVTFVDWIPGICSLIGYFIINMIDKDRIRGEEGFGDSRAVWRARLFLFIGFAFMAGGLAGSVVRNHGFFVERKKADRSRLDRLGVEVCAAQLPRAVHVLWICERLAELGDDALCSCTLDWPEHEQRVRVQPYALKAGVPPGCGMP